MLPGSFTMALISVPREVQLLRIAGKGACLSVFVRTSVHVAAGKKAYITYGWLTEEK